MPDPVAINIVGSLNLIKLRAIYRDLIKHSTPKAIIICFGRVCSVAKPIKRVYTHTHARTIRACVIATNMFRKASRMAAGAAELISMCRGRSPLTAHRKIIDSANMTRVHAHSVMRHFVNVA